MAFSYPLTMPAYPKPSEIIYRLRAAQTTSTSPFSFASQIADWGGQQWEVDLAYPPMTKTEARSWVSFLLELRGRVGSFYFYPPDDRVLGVGGGSPVVSTKISIASVSITGAPNSTSGWLNAGDWFSFANGELKRVIGNVNSDGSGNAKIIFSPNIRQDPSPSSQVATETARGIFELVDPNIKFDVTKVQHHGFRIVIQEKINV